MDAITPRSMVGFFGAIIVAGLGYFLANFDTRLATYNTRLGALEGDVAYIRGQMERDTRGVSSALQGLSLAVHPPTAGTPLPAMPVGLTP